MRIVAGQWRGRAITAPPENDARIRPTADRTRESLFNILLSNYGLPAGVRVLDLCCGTGALGLESLSRDALHCTFIDSSGDALRLVKHSVETFKATKLATILLADVVNLPPATAPCDLIFCDPPYNKNLVPVAVAKAQAQGWISDNALLVLEVGKDEALHVPGFEAIDTRHYGAAQLVFMKKNGAAERT